MPIKYDDAFKQRINADVLAKYGPVVSRLELLEYKEQTGTFPVWIYRGVRAGRGTYQVPGSQGAIGEAVSIPTPPRKRGPRKSTERAVLPTPFDDDAYDDAVEEFVPKPVVSRTLTKAQEDKLYGTPDSDEMPKPEFLHAYVCWTNRKHASVPFVEGGDTPTCAECGAKMHFHSWTKRTPIDWDKFDAEHAPKRGRKKKRMVEDDD